MEDNKTPDIPLPCTAGCGFYGNKIYNNMCSKCFKDFTERQKTDDNKTEETITESSNITETPSIKDSIETIISTKEPTNKKQDKEEEIKDTTPTLDTTTNTVTENIETITSDTTATTKVEESIPIEKPKEDKPVQKNKGRCFTCKTKIPLTKQLTNKCRCEFIFCDSHRYPDKHECQFDHASMDKDILAKNNPKLNDKPRGGRSIQRLDSF